MKPRREHRASNRTSEQTAELKAVRDQFQATKPNLDQVLAENPSAEVLPLGAVLRLHAVFAELRAERERQHLTLAEVAEKAGMDASALSRLETGNNANPTFATAERVAGALGKTMCYALVDSQPPSAAH